MSNNGCLPESEHKDVSISDKCTCKVKNENKVMLVLTMLIFCFLIVVNLSRLYSNNFWSDEIYSINVAHMSFSEIIDYAMNVDSHPPLFNLYMSLLCHIIGFGPFAYHLTSMIIYMGIMAVGVVFLRKKFGCTAAILFMILATTLDSSSYFIPEARMYEMGALLVLMSYFSLYNIIDKGSVKWYVIFTISSLAAAYTHYYCLIAVAFLYIFLFIYFLSKRDWSQFKRYFIFGLITVLGYLPWSILSLFKTVEKDTNKFWIQDTLSVYECFEYLFDNQFAFLLLLVFMIATAILLISNYFKKQISPNFECRKHTKIESAWVLAGLLSIIGTIAFAQIISALTTPLVIKRYLYPVSIIAWVIFAVSIHHLDSFKIIKNKATAVVIAILLILCIPSFCYNLNDEFSNDISTQEVVDIVNDNTEDGDILLTNMNHMNKTMGAYYYPNLKTVYFEKTLPELDHSKHYILYLERVDGKIPVDDEDFIEQLKSQGYEAENLVYQKPFATIYTVYIYDLVPIA